jgi:hypothetical protein
MNNMREANHHAIEFAEMNQRINEFSEAIQKVLKKEWTRVKFGEPLYRVVFILVAAGLLLSASVFLQQNYSWAFSFPDNLEVRRG